MKALILGFLLVSCSAHAQVILNEIDVLRPFDSSDGDGFGFALDADDGRLLIGAPWASDIGAVYVFERDSQVSWVETARLAPSDPQQDDLFGFSVALDGDRAIIGAPGDDGEYDDDGAAYVFEFTSGKWIETGRLISDPDDFNYWFGWDVALDANRCLLFGLTATDAFSFNGTDWERDELSIFYFANAGSVALDGDFGVVGETGNLNIPGSANFLENNEGSWMLGQNVSVNADPFGDDAFGFASDIQGDEALVGAYRDTVYSFTRLNGVWVQRSRIGAPIGPNQAFGLALDLDLPWALIGAPDWGSGQNVGEVYVLKLLETEWTHLAALGGSDAGVGHHFGISVTLSGADGFVGAPQRAHYASIPSSGGPGAVYIFDLSEVGVANEPRPDILLEVRLSGAYPNPFNPSTTIAYALPEAGPIRLEVFDTLGRVVRILIDEERAAGEHSVSFDASGLASGAYLYRLTSPAGSVVRTMVLLK
ncbi:MAG: T9SS type A sorting domain-containing protein [Bacteroidetes bacterium]|nr:T9SS type A sorting domain-containing protein [Bacteroidota bacterium]